jgi:hypothetical protein
MQPELTSLLERGYPAHNLQVREALTHETGITLNGRPAQIVGMNCQYPKVRDDLDGLSSEWSWASVLHIVQNERGRFVS